MYRSVENEGERGTKEERERGYNSSSGFFCSALTLFCRRTWI